MKYKILLKQHIGAPCAPIVKEKDPVKKGELIASPTGLGAPIHSPFAGVISSITEEAIIIDAAEDQPDTYEEITGSNASELLSASGLVGMGGAGFPTHIKCNIDLNGGYILVNAAECEPLLGHNIHQLETELNKTLDGIKILMKLCNAKEGVIAIKAKHEKVIAQLDEALKKEDAIRYHLLPDLYPMGEERAIVREVLGKLLAPTDLPSAANAIVINTETVYRVSEAVNEKRPVITKDVSVVGKLKKGTETQVFKDVPIGTTVGQLIEMAGGIDGDYGEIIMGGPFTGHAVDLDTPITKTTGGIIVTKPFENLEKKRIGLLLCACGGNEARMRDIATKMNGTIGLIQKCKQAMDVKGTLKCENPGNCPGQAQKCLNFKKDGCTDILIGNCSDCTNTVMGSGPKLGLTVHHQTDTVMDTVGHERIRYLTKSKSVEIDKDKVEDIPENSQPAIYEFTKTIKNGILHIDIKEGKNIHIEIPSKI